MALKSSIKPINIKLYNNFIAKFLNVLVVVWYECVAKETEIVISQRVLIRLI